MNFEKIDELLAKDEEESAIDVVFETINDLLVDGKFDVVDQILRDVKLDQIPTVIMISYLTITAAAKRMLNERSNFYNKVYDLLSKTKSKDDVKILLEGLK